MWDRHGGGRAAPSASRPNGRSASRSQRRAVRCRETTGHARTWSCARPKPCRDGKCRASTSLSLLAARAVLIFVLVFGSVVACLMLLRRAPAALRQQLEAQRAGDGRGFHQLHGDAVTQTIGLAGAAPDHGMACLVKSKIFVADRSRGDETVGAGFLQLHE